MWLAFLSSTTESRAAWRARSKWAYAGRNGAERSGGERGRLACACARACVRVESAMHKSGCSLVAVVVASTRWCGVVQGGTAMAGRGGGGGWRLDTCWTGAALMTEGCKAFTSHLRAHHVEGDAGEWVLTADCRGRIEHAQLETPQQGARHGQVDVGLRDQASLYCRLGVAVMVVIGGGAVGGAGAG